MDDILSLAQLTTARNLALEIVRVTEAAALSSFPWIGKGNKNEADHAATEAMRAVLSKIYISGTVVIGEGELDEAPMLYNGEQVGRWGHNDPGVEIAVDPLEGTALCAKNKPNAITCIAITDGKFLRAPDMYMYKIVVGEEAKGVIDLKLTPAENFIRIARAKGKEIEDLNVITMERERNQYIIDDARKLGCKVTLISDGDVSASLYALLDRSPIDVYMGIGGAPEGVITAAAVKCVGGDMQARLAFDITGGVLDIPKLKERCIGMGITDFDKIYRTEDLAQGHSLFAASGVTDGELLHGVSTMKKGFSVESVVMRSRTGTVRWLHSEYMAEKKEDAAGQNGANEV